MIFNEENGMVRIKNLHKERGHFLEIKQWYPNVEAVRFSLCKEMEKSIEQTLNMTTEKSHL